MKALYYSSLILPLTFFLCVVTFFVGLPFGFDIATYIKPHNDLVIMIVSGVTMLYVLVCIIIVLKTKLSIKEKMRLSLILFMTNMIGVPFFLRLYIKGLPLTSM